MYTPSEEYNLSELIHKADTGDLDAMRTIVTIFAVEGYLDDEGDEDIRDRYVSYLRKLAENNISEAYVMLATAYRQGTGVSADAGKAIYWYEKAVRSGIRFGNECIGMLYYKGELIEQDFEKAYTYFTKDDGGKSFCTLYALGEMYRKGLYVNKDLEKSFEYYERIAYSDDSYPEMDDYYWQADYRIAICFHYGIGTEVDLNAAYECLEEAKDLTDGFKSIKDTSDSDEIHRSDVWREWTALLSDMGKL